MKTLGSSATLKVEHLHSNIDTDSFVIEDSLVH
ncbi:hypothetical protein LINPERHAP2_LOCUS38795 [Linum perenne]